ncbi:hypothetical protein MNEG_5252 [Monoraphidium neglectum]|uniref:Uncharacterized protein n=1 Tax=Monoraphidium neglectum TaxID=145388 RepID=A0A0D2NB44_9CHLO|nr:hypothetical protein MNEG_5252 [Monoraphidium neglectum]KIZ02711.1 hypothetical protein MNEG_5252 [Monoraphidium neglectum]|eukprot:XP_013901730.1 hypothetical protein MNEG_5252 [Monoraphidium neglectum]
MLKGLLDLAHGAQTAPAAACSCAKGLAVGVQCLQSALRGEGFAAAAATPPVAAPQGRFAAAGGGSREPIKAGGHSAGRNGRVREGGGGASTSVSSSQQLAASFYSVDPLSSDLPAHDAHALRNILLHSR